MTCSIRAFEKAKRLSISKNVRRNEFDQINQKQEFLRIMHRDKTKDQVTQQFRDFRQAFFESRLK